MTPNNNLVPFQTEKADRQIRCVSKANRFASYLSAWKARAKQSMYTKTVWYV